MIVALDVDSGKRALALVRKLYPTVKIFKVGLQLYTAEGPSVIKAIKKMGAEVFLDLKFNDIPDVTEKELYSTIEKVTKVIDVTETEKQKIIDKDVKNNILK